MKYYLIPFLFFIGCSQSDERRNSGLNKTTKVTNDTIPEVRKEVSHKPVASYMIPIGDPRLEYKFGVLIYETPQTFKYLMRMQYEGMVVTDTLKVPNFGIWPTVEVRPGKEKLSCLIGFLDKEKKFKEYKMLTIKDNDLKLTVLKRYGVGVYSTKAGE
ncbi:MAG TPA: hypothetical protein VF622_04460 [Segetibacter sp.]